MIRQFLRNRRARRRKANDEAKEALLNDDNTRAEYWRALADECAESSLIALLEEALALPGDVIECGVYRGRSLRRIAKTVKDIAPDRTIYALDSFEGFPESSIGEADTMLGRNKNRLMAKFKDSGDVPERLKRFAETFDVQIDIRKGYFENTLPGLSEKQCCFLHIDSDTYASHKEILEALYDQVVPGGIIVFDDYGGKAWPGATRAVDEFFSGRPEEVQLDNSRTDAAWFARKAS